MPPQLMRKIRSIQLRLQWIEFCRRLLILTAVGEGVVFVYVLASRLFPHGYGPELVGPWLGGVWLAVLGAWNWFGRVRLFEAAVRADEDLGLKERLSSALLIRRPQGAAELAVIEDAALWARDIRPARQFPMRLGREFKFALAPLIPMILLLAFMPQFDLWAALERQNNKPLDAAVKVETETAKEAAKELEAMAQSLKEEGAKLQESPFMKQAEREIKELAKLLEENKLSNEEAMAKMSKLGDKMAERKSELEKKLDKMSDLKDLGEGKFTREVQKALEKGNFEKAAQELQKIQEKLRNGELSEEEKKTLQEEMKKLADTMEQKTGESETSNALKQAAQKLADGKTAEAMSQMDEAASQMQASAEMMEELRQMAAMEGDMKAQQESLKSGEKEGENAGSKEGPGGGKPGSKGSKAGDKAGGEGKRPWQPGDQRNKGNGLGGPGIGEGKIADREEGEVAFKREPIKGQFTAGKIIARMKVDGEQNVGEITADYEELRMQYEQKAEDSIQREMLPLEHKALVRDYFDAIKEQQDADKAARAGKPAE